MLLKPPKIRVTSHEWRIISGEGRTQALARFCVICDWWFVSSANFWANVLSIMNTERSTGNADFLNKSYRLGRSINWNEGGPTRPQQPGQGQARCNVCVNTDVCATTSLLILMGTYCRSTSRASKKQRNSRLPSLISNLHGSIIRYTPWN